MKDNLDYMILGKLQSLQVVLVLVLEGELKVFLAVRNRGRTGSGNKCY